MTISDMFAYLIIYGFIYIMFLNPLFYIIGLLGEKLLRMVLPPIIWILKRRDSKKAKTVTRDVVEYSSEYEIEEMSFNG